MTHVTYWCCPMLRRGFSAAIVLVLLALVAGAARAQAPEGARQGQAKVLETYRLQPGDEIAVSVLPQKEYDCTGVVLPDGKLYLKNVGEVVAVGMTVADLTAHITRVLQRDLVRPRVNVTITRLGNPLRPRVTVVGAVARPGPLDLEDGLRLRKALELAGGTTRDADLAHVRITRRNLQQRTIDLSRPEQALDASLNVLLEDGDSVEVPLLPNRITVGGAVKAPGLVQLEAGLRVRKAIDLAGGPTTEADLTRVSIIRSDLSRTTVDLSGPERVSDPTQNRELQDGDSIDVPARFKVGLVTVGGPGVQNAVTTELKPGMALEELVLTYGKPTTVANLEDVVLRRKGEAERRVNLVAARNSGLEATRVLLEPGDEVHVGEYADRVLFIAPTPAAGPRPVKAGQRLRDFLYSQPETVALDTSKVDLKNAQLMRRDFKKPVKVNLASVLANPSDKANVELQPGDVIVVPPKEPKGPRNDWMRNIPWVGTIFSLLL